MSHLSDILKQLTDMRKQLNSHPDLAPLLKLAATPLDLTEGLKDPAIVQQARAVAVEAQALMDSYTKVHERLVTFYEQFEPVYQYTISLGIAAAGRKVPPRAPIVHTPAQVSAMQLRVDQERAQRAAKAKK